VKNSRWLFDKLPSNNSWILHSPAPNKTRAKRRSESGVDAATDGSMNDGCDVGGGSRYVVVDHLMIVGGGTCNDRRMISWLVFSDRREDKCDRSALIERFPADALFLFVFDES
jgi:hypothetical protein